MLKKMIINFKLINNLIVYLKSNKIRKVENVYESQDKKEESSKK